MFATCVDGGMLSRLVDGLVRNGFPAQVFYQLTAESWRAANGAGRWQRTLTRANTLLAYPLRTLTATMRGDADAVVATTNPFVLPFCLTLTKAIHRRPIVVLVYDLYPDALEAVGATQPGGWLSRGLAATTRFWMRNADAVVFIGAQMAEHAQNRYGKANHVAILETGADPAELALEELEPETELEAWCAERTVISYVGNFGHMHEWETIAAAALSLWEEPTGARPLGLVFAAFGPGIVQLKRALAHLGPDKVRFVDPLDDRAWARLLNLTDIALVTLRPSAQNTSVPSKTYSAMAAGCAILAIAPHGSDLAALVQRTQCGAVREPGDVEGTIEVVNAMRRGTEHLASYQTAAQQAVVERFSTRVLAKKWQDLLAQVNLASGH